MVRASLFFILVLSSASLFAAKISVQTDRDPVALDETFRIIFTVEGPVDGEPDFSPLNKDFQLLGSGQSSSFSMVNGSISSSKTYTLSVMANRKGKLTIPAISFGKDKSPSQKITVNDAKRSGSGTGASSKPGQARPLDAPAASNKQFFITAEVDNRNPYVQQQVILKLKIYRRVEWVNPGLSDPEFDGSEPTIQPLGKQKNYQATYNGQRYEVTELRYALFPQQSGKLTIEPFRLNAKIPDGKQRKPSLFGGRIDPFSDRFFDDFFSSRRQSYIDRSAFSKAIELQVKPVPASFTGKLWLPAKSIKLKETWSADTSKLKAGEPVTRTLALIADGLGSGQLPDFRFEDLDGLKHYPDQASNREQASDHGLLSTLTQKVALIPSQGGEFKIPAVEIPWWNTRTDKMQIAKIPAQTLSVTGTTVSTAPDAPDYRTSKTDDRTPAMASSPPAAPTRQPDQQAIPYRWLLIAAGVLLFLWLATMLAWLGSKKNLLTDKTADITEAEQASLRQALKQLGTACHLSARDKQPQAIREALLQWGKAMWPTQPPNSLQEIAKRVPPELAAEIDQLSRALYSPDQANWNADVILQRTKKFKPAGLDKNRDSDPDLEPLYR